MAKQSTNVGQPLVQASLVGEAIDGGPVAIFVADEEMRYLAVNAYACELLGYTREELLERTISEISRRPDVPEVFEAFVAAGHGAGLATVTRKDGSELRLEYRAQTTTVAGLTMYVSVGWPVSDA